MTASFISITAHYAQGSNPIISVLVERVPGVRTRGKPAVPVTLRDAARLCVERERLLDASIRVMTGQDATIDRLVNERNELRRRLQAADPTIVF
jgi:hypothetical protein